MSSWISSKPKIIRLPQTSTAGSAGYQDINDQLNKPATPPQDELTVFRGTRDSGVSSPNSSVNFDHDFMGHNDVFPPPPPPALPESNKDLLQAQPATEVRESVSPLPPPPPNHIEAAATEKTSHEEHTVKRGERAREKRSALVAAAETVEDVAVEAARLAKPLASVARAPSPVPAKKMADPHEDSNALLGDNLRLVELAKSILGEDATDEDVLVVDLTRPDGSTGGGVGMVLTGGADYEVNQIKVTEKLTFSH